jgi:hypothetical protein
VPDPSVTAVMYWLIVQGEGLSSASHPPSSTAVAAIPIVHTDFPEVLAIVPSILVTRDPDSILPKTWQSGGQMVTPAPSGRPDLRI